MTDQSDVSRREFMAIAGAAVALSTSPAIGQSQPSPKDNKTDKSEKAYDYVIIGGGTAGLVMAGRLTEDPDISVMVIEAGPENTFETGAYAAGAAGMWGPATNWSYNSAPQPALNNRKLMQPRGKVIGGCAAINVGSWSRGTPGNYESWGIPGWEWDKILKTYKKIEASPRSNTELRGKSGPMRFEDTPLGSGMTDVFRKAAIEVGVGTTTDRNAADPIGFDVWETIFPSGRRWNTEHGYLIPARKRGNLTVVTDAHVKKINFEGKRATGVSFAIGDTDQQAMASKEVLLCAGAINSPQILMLSGVGPAEHLRKHGIDVIQDSPAVGQNLSDHLRAQFGALTPKGVGEPLYSDPKDPEQLEEWRSTGYGPLAFAENTSSAFVKSSDEAPHPDVELLYSVNPPYSMREDKTRGGWYIMVGIVQPKSKGSVTLASNDPMDKPIYDPAYLSDAEDMDTFVKGMRLALAHVKTKALTPYTDKSTLSLAVDATDEAIEAHIRSTVASIFHPVGSVKMGRVDDDSAPLDPHCRVKGVDGLRVIDASSVPELVSGHTMAPTIMVAERIAELMKQG